MPLETRKSREGGEESDGEELDSDPSCYREMVAEGAALCKGSAGGLTKVMEAGGSGEKPTNHSPKKVPFATVQRSRKRL